MPDLKFERRFKSDPETVFAFITQPEHTAKWWGPEGVSVQQDCNLDLSRLGPWVCVMENAEGQTFKVSGEVMAYDPPNTVAYTWGWHDGETDERGHESTVYLYVSLLDGGGSLLVLEHVGLPEEEGEHTHESGWRSTLIKLVACLD